MNFARPLGSAEIEKSSEVEAEEISTNWRVVVALCFALARLAMSKCRPTILLGCCAEYQKHDAQIENLTGDLQALRKKLHTDGDRIQRDIAEYGELAQQVMQLTKIISESVKKLPTAPRVNR